MKQRPNYLCAKAVAENGTNNKNNKYAQLQQLEYLVKYMQGCVKNRHGTNHNNDVKHHNSNNDVIRHIHNKITRQNEARLKSTNENSKTVNSYLQLSTTEK